jgi:UTP--glucose-1-phosphate uridylyltransferase
MKRTDEIGHLTEFIQKMEKAGIDPITIDTFSYYYKKTISGETGLICENHINRIDPDELEDTNTLKSFSKAGERARDKAVMLVLNGGLGTSMGLSCAKSLIEAKNGQSFLEITLQQAKVQGMKLCFMNSFNTHKDTLAAVSKLDLKEPPLYFLQNRFPKILHDEFLPASWPKNRDLEWNPPGHGDVYTALHSSGMLTQLLNEGIRYAFISNLDNLGATLDETLLGYFSENNLPFMMEVCERTPADMKGGHIARHKNNRLILRELAQCPKKDLNRFQDINYHRFFNTNNIWINLSFLKKLIETDGGVRLPMILNPKFLDPRDESSPPVYQIETAMGSAIFLFHGATAVKVPKERLLPVKTCNDLLAIRSDCFVFTKEKNLIRNPERKLPPIIIKLDPRYYRKIDQFDRRFAHGIPSLIECESLAIEGDVCFESNVVIRGKVVIQNRGSRQATIKEGAAIDKDVIL